MASPKVPYNNPAQHEEHVQQRAADEYARRMGRIAARNAPPTKLCRKCAVPLTSGAEYRLGIHVWCVYAIEKQAAAMNIPRPRYGSNR